MMRALPADRLDDFRQYVDRADALVELAAAMVRHIDAVDPVLERDPGVLGGGDAFQDQRDVEALLDPLDIAPVELRLEDAGIGDAHPAALVALGDVALAPAVAVGVDGQAKGVVALVDRAAHMVVDPGGVAAHIELEDLEAVAGGLGGLVEPGMRHRAQDHAVAEVARRLGDRRAAARLEHFERADRRHNTGMRSFLPNSELLQSMFDTSRKTRGRKPIASSARRLRATVVSVSEPPIR